MKLSRAYLTERVTLEDVVAEHDFESCPADFRADLERLLSLRAAGDEMWRFASPPGGFEVAGIALVRDGEVVATLVDSAA